MKKRFLKSKPVCKVTFELPAQVVNASHQVVTIDTPGPTESLNAASAAAILVHELSKPGGHGTQRV